MRTHFISNEKNNFGYSSPKFIANKRNFESQDERIDCSSPIVYLNRNNKIHF